MLSIGQPSRQIATVLISDQFCGNTSAFEGYSMLVYGRPLPPKIQSCQIAQTKRKWSGNELRNGSNNKEIIILKIKVWLFCVKWFT